MAEDLREITELMRRVSRHSDAAARELVTRFGPRILRMVRRRLPRALRPKFDSGDFVQSVWASFFALPLEDLQLKNTDALGPFLAEMASHKVVDAVRTRLQTAKHDISREQPYPQQADVLCSSMPSPEAIAIAREEWERLLREEPSNHQRMLLSLGEGETAREVARKHGYSTKTVQRLVRRVRRAQEPQESNTGPIP